MLGDKLKWGVIYTAAFGHIGAVCNGLARLGSEGTYLSFREGFGDAYANHWVTSFGINMIHPFVIPRLRNRYIASAYIVAAISLVGLGHYLLGTSSPAAAFSANYVIGITLVNKHFSDTRKLEEIVDDKSTVP